MYTYVPLSLPPPELTSNSFSHFSFLFPFSLGLQPLTINVSLILCLFVLHMLLYIRTVLLFIYYIYSYVLLYHSLCDSSVSIIAACIVYMTAHLVMYACSYTFTYVTSACSSYRVLPHTVPFLLQRSSSC